MTAPAPGSDRPISHAVIAGDCAPGFEGVRDEFRANFVARGEVGAALCVIHRGEVIIDLWGGWADEAQTLPWERDTIVDFYSVGKAIVAVSLLQLVDRGALGLDTPVADIWPEFAAGGKQTVTVRQALCHEAAVPAIRERLTDDDLYDWETMTAALASTEPWWPIGTRHVYHTNTYGFLVGEIVRRVTGEMPDTALRGFADDLDADVHFGVPLDEQRRCADVIWAADPPSRDATRDLDSLDADTRMNVLAHFNPPGASSVGVVNSPGWRAAQVPSTNGHGSARGVARIYAGLLEPDRILSVPMRTTAAEPQAMGPCSILGEDVAFGLGFVPTSARRPFGPNPGSFGHFGTGGALGFADPESDLAFGYVMNHVIPRWQSTRNRSLIDALYQST